MVLREKGKLKFREKNWKNEIHLVDSWIMINLELQWNLEHVAITFISLESMCKQGKNYPPFLRNRPNCRYLGLGGKRATCSANLQNSISEIRYL